MAKYKFVLIKAVEGWVIEVRDFHEDYLYDIVLSNTLQEALDAIREGLITTDKELIREFETYKKNIQEDTDFEAN